MDKYKPTYMGQVMPADDPSKLTDFVSNKYDSFSKAYDAVKDESEKINAVSAAGSADGSSEFSMKVNADKETLDKIKEKVKDDDSVKVNGDTVTVKS